MSALPAARTYNQSHVPRQHTPVAGASASTGRGATRGKPNAIPPQCTTASPP